MIYWIFFISLNNYFWSILIDFEVNMLVNELTENDVPISDKILNEKQFQTNYTINNLICIIN